MAGFRDDVVIVVEEEQVEEMLLRLVMATSTAGIAAWAKADIDPWLSRRAANRFDSEGDKASGGWKPLSALSQEWREMQGFPPDHPINVRTGALKDYVTRKADGFFYPNGAGGGRYLYPGDAVPFTNYIAAKLKTAQQGRKRGENKLFANATTPARPVLALDETDVLALTQSYANYLHAFVGAGAGTTTVSGTFGGAITTPSGGITRGQLFSAGGGNFS